MAESKAKLEVTLSINKKQLIEDVKRMIAGYKAMLKELRKGNPR